MSLSPPSSSSTSTNAFENQIVSILQDLVNSNLTQLQFRNAAFYAEKLHTIKKDVNTLYLWAECLYHCRDYKSALYALDNDVDCESSLKCLYLAACINFEAEKLTEAEERIKKCKTLIQGHRCWNENSITGKDIQNLKSAIYLMEAKIAEQNGNVMTAMNSYKLALQENPTCYEAFLAFTRYQVMQEDEVVDILRNLNEDEIACKISKFFYNMQLPFDEENTGHLHVDLHRVFGNTLEMMLDQALIAFNDRESEEVLKLCSKIRRLSPFNEKCLTIQISCLFEERRISELFSIGHELLQTDRRWSITYFAIAAYYLSIVELEPCKRFLRKAIQLAPINGYYWLAMGHAFAASSEHDQAISCYFNASKYLRGSHYPLMYVGIEYTCTNNPRLSEKFLSEAFFLKQDDAALLHEIGVVQYELGNYENALMSMESARRCLKENPSKQWEVLYCNIGHAHRKLKNYPEAIKFFDMSLNLNPGYPPTAIAKTVTLLAMGELDKAFDILHASSWWTNEMSRLNMVAFRLLNRGIELTKPPPMAITEDTSEKLKMFNLRPWALFKDVAACEDLESRQQQQREGAAMGEDDDESLMSQSMRCVYDQAMDESDE